VIEYRIHRLIPNEIEILPKPKESTTYKIGTERFAISSWNDIPPNNESKILKFTTEIRSQWPQL